MGTTEYCTVLGTVGGLFDADYVTSSWERENQCSDFNFSSFYSSLEQVSNVSLPTWQRATTLLVSIYSHLPTGNRTALRYGIVRGSLWKISFRATYLQYESHRERHYISAEVNFFLPYTNSRMRLMAWRMLKWLPSNSTENCPKWLCIGHMKAVKQIDKPVDVGMPSCSYS